MMKFEVHDCDPNTGEEDEQGFPDEYVIDDIEITVGDFIQKGQLFLFINFRRIRYWSSVGH